MSGELASRFEKDTPPPTDVATGQPAGIVVPAPVGWPAAPATDAFHGLPGAIVEKIAPHTEGDPVAILTQLLVACGALIGRAAWFQVEATRHHPNQFLLLIGDTSRGRKGSVLDHVTRLLDEVDPAFPARLATGLSSGEGVVWKVRDGDGQDPGAADKRLLVIETEFASVLKSANRETSTLSSTLRCVWDARPLALMTRTAPATATGAHISIIAHITHSELRRHATTIEVANGFLNRFMLAAVRRVRLLPEGGNPDPLKSTGLARYLTATLKHAKAAGQLKLDAAARELWWHSYPQLTQPAEGLAGELTARAEAHTIRLALLYALLDGERRIQTEHLKAALALWQYAARSATWALGQATGDPLAEQLHAALTRSPEGLTRTQLSDLLDHHQPAKRIQQALDTLQAQGRAHHTRILTAGRPAERWHTTPQRDHRHTQ